MGRQRQFQASLPNWILLGSGKVDKNFTNTIVQVAAPFLMIHAVVRQGIMAVTLIDITHNGQQRRMRTAVAGKTIHDGRQPVEWPVVYRRHGAACLG